MPGNPRWEREAERAAAAVLGGAVDQGAKLSPAPAARASVPGSPGAPLAAPVRGRLERGFGAQLGAVRLHTDAAAAHAARERRADAFTAGSDVYLDLPASELTGERGFLLLAHEIAHVLQQTSRRGPDGRPHATAVRGGGEVQRSANLAEDLKAIKALSDKPPTFADLKATYDSGGKDPDLDKVIGDVETLLGTNDFATATPTNKTDLVAKTTAATYATLAPTIQGFLLDCVKAVGRHADAAVVFEKHLRAIPTRFLSFDFYSLLRKPPRTFGWVVPRITATKPFSDFYPGNMTDAFRIDFYSWFRDVTSLQGSPDKVSKETVKQLVDIVAGRTAGNECDIAATFALAQFDKLRKEQRAGILKEVAGKLPSGQTTDRRSLGVLAGVAEVFAKNTLAKLPQENEEQLAIATDFAPKLRPVAERAFNYWSTIQTMYEALIDKREATVSGVGDRAKIIALIGGLGASKDVGNLDGELAAVTKEALADPPASSPPPAATSVGAARQREIARLKAVAIRLEDLLSGKARTPAKTLGEMTETGLRLGLALHLLLVIINQFEHYDVSADDAFRKKGIDYWVGERLQLSRLVWDYSVLYGLTTSRAVAEAFRSPTRAEIAMIGEWVEIPPPEGSKGIVDDLGNAEPKSLEGTGIVWDLFTRFAQAMYFEELSRKVGQLLQPPNDKDYSPRDKSILTEAVESAQKVPRPKRYRMTAYWFLGDQAQWVMKQGAAPTAVHFDDLVLSNKRLKELPDGLAGTAGDPAKHKTVTGADDAVFVWQIPHADMLVAELRKNTVLDQQVRDHYKVMTGEDAPAVLTPWKWLETLGDLTESLKLAKDPKQAAIAADIEGRLESRIDKAWTDAQKAGRRATTHLRRSVEQNELIPMLAAFDRHELEASSQGTDIGESIRRFAYAVWPPEDKALHVAAMMIELAPQLVRAFGEETGLLGTGVLNVFSVTRWLAPLLSGTLTSWDDKELRPVIAALTELPETGFFGTGFRIAVLRGLYGKLWFNKEREIEGTGVVGRLEANRRPAKLVGSKASATLDWPHLGHELGAGSENQISISGKTWKLVSIDHDFVFYPPIDLTNLGIAFKYPFIVGESRLFEADGTTPLDKKTQLFTMQYTDLDKLEVSDPTPVFGYQSQTLENIAIAVINADLVAQLDALGVAIMAATNFVLDVLEFVPGIGQGVMALRFVQTLVDMLVSEDFANVLKMFQEDGIGAIVKLLQGVASMFDIEKLLMWLLFSNMTLPFSKPPAHEPKGQQKQQIASGQGKFAKIGKVISNVFGFGGKLVRSISRIQKRTSVPFRGLKLWVVEHPTAALILDFIVDVALPYAELTLDLLIEHAGDDVTGDIKGAFSEMVAGGIEGILQRAADAVGELRFLELPEEIIDTVVIVDFLLDLVINRLGTKYKVALKIVRAGLEKIGWLRKIEAQIAKVLPDPNELYRQAVRDNLQPHLDKVRQTLIDEVMARFGEYAFVKQLLKKPAAPTSDAIDLDFHGDEFPDDPEASRSPADSPFADAALGPMPTPHGGEPLAPNVRASSEAAVGHDLGHVRLHRGADAARVTHNYVADGVTTGSHVYLRPGLSPDVGHGGHVLRHELSHVIDQTGARPLGATHDDRPSAGSPGRGAVWDGAAEARAESVAHGAVARPPAKLAAGIQPSILSAKFLADFIKELKDPSRLQKQAKRTDKIGKGAAKLDDPKAKAAADALVASFTKAIDDPKVFKLEPPFDKVRTHLVDYLKSKDVGDRITHAIPHLVKAAMTSVVLKKIGDQPKREVPYVPPNAVDVELTEFLYGETGLALQVKLNSVKDAELANRLVVDTNDPYKSLELIYLHIPFVQGETGTKLLAEAVGNTYPNVTADDEKSFLVNIASMLITRLGPRPDIWHKKQFKFHDAMKRRIDEQKKSLEKVVKAKAWPTPKQYVVTDSTKVPDDTDSNGKAVKGSTVSDVGLRLGTYATWGPKGKSGSPDRDAHHITQYVFFQYLANKKLLKPFWKANQRAKLGIKPASGDVATIEQIGSNKHNTLLVGKFEKDRGGEMATIYIARNTHRSDVHIHGESIDDEMGSSRESQGGTVHNLFRAGVRAALPGAGDTDVLASASVLKQLVAAPDPETKVETDAGKLSQVDVNKAIFAGVQSLWEAIAGEMDPKLEKALKTQEVAYYNLIAERRKLTAKLTEGDVAPVYGELTARNKKVIGDDSGVK